MCVKVCVLCAFACARVQVTSVLQCGARLGQLTLGPTDAQKHRNGGKRARHSFAQSETFSSRPDYDLAVLVRGDASPKLSA